MTIHRDPVSVWFDQKALDLLRRGYHRFGQWTDTYMPPPTPRQRERAASFDIDLDAADPWGEPNRWVRAYKRSCYHNLLHYGYEHGLNTHTPRHEPGYLVAMQWKTVGQAHRPGSPVLWWHFRVRLAEGGEAARAAVATLPDDERFTANPAEWLQGRDT